MDGNVSVSLGAGDEERNYSGTYADPDSFVLSGTYVEEEIAFEVETTFTRLDARDLSELEIQDRRCGETTHIAEAIQAYFKDNRRMPELLADIVPQYLASSQLVESSPSRHITYIPVGTGYLADINEYPNARTHQERLLRQEADRLTVWPTFPSKPPMLTVQYTVPPMTLISYMVELPQAVRIDLGSSMGCPRIRSDARDALNVKKCEGNMKSLGDALRAFASGDREGRYPGGFAVTSPNMKVNGREVTGLFNTMDLTCPSLGEEDRPGRTVSFDLLFPAFNKEDLLAVGEELGFGSADELAVESEIEHSQLASIPLVIELHECSNSGGSHVLFVDGHVELLMPNDWKTRVRPFVEYSERYYADL